MHNKIFYVSLMYGRDMWWPAKNFNSEELEIIERFLEELNEHVSGGWIDDIDVLDDDEEE